MTQEILKQYIKYCPLTGIAIHIKQRSNVHFGDIVGTANRNGYIQTSIEGVMYYLHRLIWLYMTGQEVGKDFEIDHINGCGTDNRWCNLRRVTPRENCLNQKCHRNGQLIGVTFNSTCNKWVARAPRDKETNKQKHLGYFYTMEEAHEAYIKYTKK